MESNFFGNKQSEEKEVYFGDEEKDRKIREQGFITAGDDIKEGKLIPFGNAENPVPKNLQIVEIEAHNFPEERIRNFFCYDPLKIEVKTVEWRKWKKENIKQLDKERWELIDSNIARGIYKRPLTKSKE